MIYRFFALLVLLIISGIAWSSSRDWQPEPSAVWPTGPGTGVLELRGDYLPDFGLKVRRADAAQRDRVRAGLNIADTSLWLFMPFGNFEAFSGGEIGLTTDLSLHHGDRSLILSDLRLVPAEQDRIPVLQLADSENRHLATVTHIHLTAQPRQGMVTLHNADVIATATLADILRQPALEGMPIGQLWLDLGLQVPTDADTSGRGVDFSGRGLECEDRPLWPQDGHEVNVQLIAIGNVAGQGFEPDSGRLKITPAATLKNIGEADVPWFRQFVPAPQSLYPHEPRDQHPFLVWNLYRIMDGRIEQLAASGAKHAFFTININCDLNCANGNILWPGCEDIYGVGNNNDPQYLAPRAEIQASLGLWDSCGSFFDPDCSGSQPSCWDDPNQPGCAGQWKNRLLVNPEALDHGSSGAEYFLDAWYVVQFDVDIWKTMGYHRINPSQGGAGGYTFGPLGPFRNGPPISEWIVEDTDDPLAAHRVITVPPLTPNEPYPFNMPQGHLRLLAKAEEVDVGLWRYRYALMNFDFDRGIESFALALPEEAELVETWMGGPPDVLDQAWSATRRGNQVEFRGAPGESLPWFTLYNFEIVTDAEPVVDGGVVMGVPGCRQPVAIQAEVPAPGPAPQPGVLFRDRFAEC